MRHDFFTRGDDSVRLGSAIQPCDQRSSVRYGYAPLLALLLAVSACTHTPPATAPVIAAPAQPASAPAAARPRHAPSASATAPAAPTSSSPSASTSASAVHSPDMLPAPGLSYRPNQPVRQLADGSRLPAVRGLLNAADRAVQAGDLDRASANLERAQRMAPQSALVYQRLADVRLRQKRPADAEQMARKALAFTAQMAQQAALWRQIAAARQQQGQTQAAQEALQKAALLEGDPGAAPPSP